MMRRLTYLLLLLPNILLAQVYTFSTDDRQQGYYNRPYQRYEAEEGWCTYQGTMLEASDDQRLLQSEASHQQAVQLLTQDDSVAWVIDKAANALTLRFSLPDNEEGTGNNGMLQVALNGTLMTTVAVSSYWAWQYCNQNYPQNAPLSGNVIIRMRFDETHLLLPDTLQPGDILTLRKAVADDMPYTIDFVELEMAPKPVAYDDIKAADKVAFTGDGDIADFIAANEGKTIYIPAGRWNTAKRIYLRSKHGTRLIGAGMWYSEIYFTAPSDDINTYSKRGIEATKDSLVVEGLYLNTACRQRYYNQEDSKQVGKGFMGGWGRGSTIRQCWVEHFECGGWIADYSGGKSENLLIEHCRIRNNYADGINCSQASSGHTVQFCSFRNNGDDDMASWSTGRMVKDITFAYCTAENNWRASSLGFFGGQSPTAHHIAIFDGLECGMRVNADFSGTGFDAQAVVDIHDVTVVHCGCQSGTKGQKGDFWGNAQGAVNIGNTNYYSVPNVHLSNVTVNDSRGNALYILSKGGKNVSGLLLDSVAISGAQGYGIYYSGATGEVTYCNVTIADCVKGEQSAHMPTYVINDCNTAAEEVQMTDKDSKKKVLYFDLLGRPLREDNLPLYYIRIEN